MRQEHVTIQNVGVYSRYHQIEKYLGLKLDSIHEEKIENYWYWLF